MRIDGQPFVKWFFDTSKSEKTEKIQSTTVVEKENQDEIDFNVSSKDLSEFFTLAKNGMDIREDKLQEIKAKQEKGEYNISGKDIVLKVLGDKLHDTNNH